MNSLVRDESIVADGGPKQTLGLGPVTDDFAMAGMEGVASSSDPHQRTDDPDSWFVAGPQGELGPMPGERLRQFVESGVVPADALVRNGYSNQRFQARMLVGSPTADASPVQADAPKAGPPASTGHFPSEAVEFQTFAGELDPAKQGKGTVTVGEGVLTLRGRGRRLFAIRKHDEKIPLDKVEDVNVSGRVVRFSVADTKLVRPRLLRLSSPESAARLVACLPETLSEAGRQKRADDKAFAVFLEESGPAQATRAIIGLNFLIYVVAGLAGAGWMTGNATVLLDLGGNFAVSTTNGQWWRLLTSMFLHTGLLHVAFNMWALWDAGRVAEPLFGRMRYLALYLLAGVAGGIASINWQQDLVGVGASGAVFGVYGGLVAALLLRPDLLPSTITKKLRGSATVFICYSLFNGFSHAGIDNAAHLGGLVVGALVGTACVLPSRRALAATLATLIAIGFGAVRAAETAAPYKDELAFRQFLVAFGEAEAKLNAAAATLGKKGNALTEAELQSMLDRTIVPGWREQDARISSLQRVTPRSQQLRDKLARYIHLRHDSWELLAEAARRNDPSAPAIFAKKSGEANTALQELNTYIGGMGNGSRQGSR